MQHHLIASGGGCEAKISLSLSESSNLSLLDSSSALSVFAGLTGSAYPPSGGGAGATRGTVRVSFGSAFDDIAADGFTLPRSKVRYSHCPMSYWFVE